MTSDSWPPNPDSDATVQPGDVLANRFEILSHLGSGGMGEVYEAEDRDLKSRIALKVIRREAASDPQALARFRKEIALARKVTHRSVCRVFDFFPAATSSRGSTVDFLTMELLTGETLSHYLLRQGPLTLPQAIPILTQIAAGLDAAHSANVLHRDLKGSNIILTTDAQGLRAVITDFGLARSHRPDGTERTSSTQAAGTPLYMSPEQLEGHELTPASDLYSLGILMYEMATGLPPYQGQSPLQVVIQRVKDERPPAPSTLQKDIDPRWESAILRCLSYNPAERYATATALIDALGGPYRPTPPAPNRTPLYIAATALLLALTAFLWYRNHVPPVSPEAARWYTEGLRAVSTSSWSSAARAFERAAHATPNFVAAHCRLAEAYLELDRRDNAQEQLLIALAAKPRDNDEALLREGTQALLAAKSADTVRIAEQRLTTAADPITAQLDLARWAARAASSERAITACNTILSKDPSQPGALLRLAAVYISQNKPALAIPLLDRARTTLEAFNNPEGLAEVDLTKAKLLPNLPDALALAIRAEQAARQAKNPSLTVRALLVRADRLEAQGKLDASLKFLRQAMQIADANNLYADSINTRIELAYAPFSKGNYESAINEFQAAATLASQYRTRRAEARALTSVAQSYIYANQPDKALPILEQTRAFYLSAGFLSLAVQTLMFRADAFMRLSRFDEARQAYTDALEQSPSPAAQLDLRARRARVSRQQARYDLAAEEYRQLIVLSQSMNNPTYEQGFLLDYADTLTALGRFDLASSQLHTLETQGFKTPRIAIQYSQELAHLEFERMEFGPAIARLEKLRAELLRDKKEILERETRNQLCAKYAEANRPVPGVAVCTSLLKDFAERPAIVASIQMSMALFELAENRPHAAIESARKALINSQKASSPPNEVSALQILALALHKVKNPEWQAARDQANAVLENYSRRMPPADLQSFLRRPLLSRRQKLVDALH